MFERMTKDTVIKPGDHWVTISEGMRGWFAVRMWLSNERPGQPFPEPYDTGVGRYGLESSAREEAYEMARDLNLPYDFDPPTTKYEEPA